MKKLVARSIAASVLGSVFSIAALAQGVAFHGAMADPANVPRDVAVPTVVNPPGNVPEQGGTPKAFGPTLWSVYNAGPCDSAVRAGTVNLSGCFSVGGDVQLGFPVHIPTGALVSYARIYFNQTVLANGISAGFWKTDPFGVGSVITGMTPTDTTAGNTMQQWGPFSEVIDNAPSAPGNTYSFLAITSGATKIYKMMVYYKLQVSPAPASASFTDVPTGHWAFQFIQALRYSGITTGCTPTTYCPDANVTRAEMAVFMSRALGLAFEF